MRPVCANLTQDTVCAIVLQVAAREEKNIERQVSSKKFIMKLVCNNDNKNSQVNDDDDDNIAVE